MVGIVVSSHIGWKYLQDIGVGDQGRDYPHKHIPKVIKEVMLKEKSEEGPNQ